MIIEKCLRYTRAPVSARINPCPLFSTSVFDNFAEISWKFLKFLIEIFLHPLQILSLKSLNFTFLNFKKSRLICLSIFIAHVSYQSKEIEQIKQKKRLELRSLTLRRFTKQGSLQTARCAGYGSKCCPLCVNRHRRSSLESLRLHSHSLLISAFTFCSCFLT